MQVHEAEERVWLLTRDYSQALRKAGSDCLVDNKPQIAVNHLLKKLRPAQQYLRMQDRIMWRKKKKFEKESFNRFVRKVARQAKKKQTELRITAHRD